MLYHQRIFKLLLSHSWGQLKTHSYCKGVIFVNRNTFVIKLEVINRTNAAGIGSLNGVAGVTISLDCKSERLIIIRSGYGKRRHVNFSIVLGAHYTCAAAGSICNIGAACRYQVRAYFECEGLAGRVAWNKRGSFLYSNSNHIIICMSRIVHIKSVQSAIRCQAA